MFSSREQFNLAINTESSTRSIISISNSNNNIPSISSLSIEELSNAETNYRGNCNSSIRIDLQTEITGKVCNCDIF